MPHVPDAQKFRGKHGSTVQPINLYYDTPGQNNVETPVRLGNLPGTNPTLVWDVLTQIHYIPAQDTGPQTFLQQAADNLKRQLERVRATPSMAILTGADPTGQAVRLRVDAAAFTAANPSDSYRLLADPTGLTITGKTPMGTRHGVFGLLHEMGYRWFFMHQAWHVTPSRLTMPRLVGAVVAPDYENRELRVIHSALADSADGPTRYREWKVFNAQPSTEEYLTHHSYNQIKSLSKAVQEDPAAVCYGADGVTPKNLNPTHPTVLQWAKEYAARKFAEPEVGQTRMVVPISPEDGLPVCAGWDSDTKPQYYQVVTDDIFSLTNEIAKYLQTAYPGKYAGVYSYNIYFRTPSYTLESNVHVLVTTGLGIAAQPQYVQPLLERIAGMAPAKVGFYAYLTVWQYTHDRTWGPGKRTELLQELRDCNGAGAFQYWCESGSNFGTKGLGYWMASRLCWDTSLTDASLVTDFCEKAYGPASPHMRTWHDRWEYETIAGGAAEKHRLGFPNLDAALGAVDPTSSYATRIRHIILWAYYDWRWGAAIKSGNVEYSMTDADLRALWNYVWRMTNMHLISPGPEKKSIKREAKAQYGYTDADFAGPSGAFYLLQDTTPHSDAEVRALLDAALSGTP